MYSYPPRRWLSWTLCLSFEKTRGEEPKNQLCEAVVYEEVTSG
jgi:hypothetical protein